MTAKTRLSSPIPRLYERPLVVFVDDELAFLQSSRALLYKMEAEWDMRFFSTPEDAVELLTSRRDAVLLADWNMPKMSGLVLCNAVQRQTLGHYLILLSGCGSTELVVSALNQGIDDFVAKPFAMRELIARIRVGVRRNRERCRVQRVMSGLRNDADTDALTGLRNRRWLLHQFADRPARAALARTGVGIIFADIDHFKAFNDRHGHPAGDILLQQVARCIVSVLRKNDVAIRWGGDEFCVLCYGTTASELGCIAERLRAAVAESLEAIPGEPGCGITVSVGTSFMAACGDHHLDSRIALADKALYLAKRNGRNRTVAS